MTLTDWLVVVAAVALLAPPVAYLAARWAAAGYLRGLLCQARRERRRFTERWLNGAHPYQDTEKEHEQEGT